MFRNHKDNAAALPNALKVNPDKVIRSKRVMEDVERYYSIALPADYTEADYDSAYRELDVFRKDYYGSGESPDLQVVVNGLGRNVLRFPIVMASGGTDWNPQLFPNAVDVETLL